MFHYTYLVFAFSLVMIASYFGNKYKKSILDHEQTRDYDLVSKYLLDDAALYGNKKPKLWIHTTYEANARKWLNFMSRKTTDLNQPYLFLTVQSIINYCANDFHICLIDDQTFGKLIPTWTIDLSTIPEPMKRRQRQIGVLQLIYMYGGMTVPNSFLCLKPLIELYKQGISHNTPFLAESYKKVETIKTNISHFFLPHLSFMGAKKEDPIIQEIITQLNKQQTTHFENEMDFERKINVWLFSRKDLQLIDGSIIGLKTKIGKPILLEDLMSSDYLDVDASKLYGIYIPGDELLRRPKFQYFSILPYDEVMKTDSILSKYFQQSMVDIEADDYYKKSSNIMSSLIAI